MKMHYHGSNYVLNSSNAISVKVTHQS